MNGVENALRCAVAACSAASCAGVIVEVGEPCVADLKACVPALSRLVMMFAFCACCCRVGGVNVAVDDGAVSVLERIESCVGIC